MPPHYHVIAQRHILASLLTKPSQYEWSLGELTLALRQSGFYDDALGQVTPPKVLEGVKKLAKNEKRYKITIKKQGNKTIISYDSSDFERKVATALATMQFSQVQQESYDSISFFTDI